MHLESVLYSKIFSFHEQLKEKATSGLYAAEGFSTIPAVDSCSRHTTHNIFVQTDGVVAMRENSLKKRGRSQTTEFRGEIANSVPTSRRKQRRKKSIVLKPPGKSDFSDAYYVSHLKDLNSAINRCLKKNGIKLKIKFKDPKGGNKKYIREMCELEEGFQDRVWTNQVETFVDVLAKCLQNPGQSGVIIGSTQLGKTMIMILCTVISHALFMKTDEPYRFVIVVPGKKSLARQTKEDWKAFVGLYNFEIETPDGEYLEWNEYLKQTSSSVAYDERFTTPIVSRTIGQGGVNRLDEEVAKYHEDGMHLIYLIDEYHWGEAAGGITDRMLNMSKTLQEEGHGDFMIAVSATPWHLTNLDSLWKVTACTYPSYVGYAFFGGELFDERHPLRLPIHIGFDDPRMRTVFDLADFEYVNRNYYCNADSYYKECAKVGRVNNPNKFAEMWDGVDHEGYVEFVEDRLICFFNSCLVENNENDSRGMAVRFFLKKPDVEDFKNRAYELGLDENIEIVAWQEKAVKEDVGAYIDSLNIPQDKKVLVLVTGSGRMGDRFPKYIRYFAEFAEGGTLMAQIQGLLGRSTGPREDLPYVFMSSSQAERLSRFVDNLGVIADLKGSLGTNLKRDKTYKSQTLQMHPHNFLEMERPDLLEFLNSYVKREFKGCRSVRDRNSSNKSYERYREFWDVMFSEETLCFIEDYYGLNRNSMVRFTPKGVDGQLRPPYTDSESNAYDVNVGFRTAGRQSSTNSNLSSDRLVDKTKSNKQRLLSPQIHVRKVGRQWQFVTLKIRSNKVVTYGSKLVLPTPRSSAYHRFNVGKEEES